MGRDYKIPSALLTGQRGSDCIVEFMFDEIVLKCNVSVLQIENILTSELVLWLWFLPNVKKDLIFFSKDFQIFKKSLVF